MQIIEFAIFDNARTCGKGLRETPRTPLAELIRQDHFLPAGSL